MSWDLLYALLFTFRFLTTPSTAEQVRTSTPQRNDRHLVLQ